MICLHGTLYAAEYGWDHTLEVYVAGPFSEFGNSHIDRERIWIVEKVGKVAGSIAIQSEHQQNLIGRQASGPGA